MKKIIKRIEEEYDDKCTIRIKCNKAAKDELMPLLKELKYLGNVGASRSIEILDWDGDNKFGFDGDGPSTIYDIKEE